MVSLTTGKSEVSNLLKKCQNLLPKLVVTLSLRRLPENDDLTHVAAEGLYAYHSVNPNFYFITTSKQVSILLIEMEALGYKNLRIFFIVESLNYKILEG